MGKSYNVSITFVFILVIFKYPNKASTTADNEILTPEAFKGLHAFEEYCATLILSHDDGRNTTFGLTNSEQGYSFQESGFEDFRISYINVDEHSSRRSIFKVCNRPIPEHEKHSFNCSMHKNSGPVDGSTTLIEEINYVRCAYEKAGCTPSPTACTDPSYSWQDSECAHLFNNNNCNECTEFEIYRLDQGPAQCASRVENWSLRIRNSSFTVFGGFADGTCNGNPTNCLTGPLPEGVINEKYDMFSCCLGEDDCYGQEQDPSIDFIQRCMAPLKRIQ